jgi:hypothetical protein
MNFTKYIVFTFFGSLVWSISLTVIEYMFGKTWQSAVTNYTQVLNYALVLSLVAVSGYYIIHKYMKKRCVESDYLIKENYYLQSIVLHNLSYIQNNKTLTYPSYHERCIFDH